MVMKGNQNTTTWIFIEYQGAHNVFKIQKLHNLLRRDHPFSKPDHWTV